MLCPRCRAELPEEGSRCPACGAESPPRASLSASEPAAPGKAKQQPVPVAGPEPGPGTVSGVAATIAVTPEERSGDAGEGASASALPPDKTWSAGHIRRFRLLAHSEPKGCFFGIPSFDPPIDATRLFNIWAYILGPFYYLGKGMWRKALVLALLVLAVAVVNGLVSTPRTALGGEVLLREALLEEYAGAGYALMLLGFLFPLCVGLGKNLWAVLVACAVVAVFLWGEVHYPFLDLGSFSGFSWLNAVPIWNGLAGAALFSLLARRFAAFLTLLALLALVWGLGLPFPAVSCLEFSRVVIDLLCGMSATWDLYRRRVRHERFWW